MTPPRAPAPGVRIFRAVLLAPVLAACALPALTACREKPPAAPAAPALRKDAYTVRGVVVQLPSPDHPGREFQVRHEAMPHFVGEGGALGMDTMIMPFPLAPGLSLDGLRVGSKIELAFEVDFNPAAGTLEGYRATGWTPLPDDTELDFTPLPR